LSLTSLTGLAFSDTITFRDGRSVFGSFLGGDSRTVRVAVNDRVETYPLGDIASISFEQAVATTSAPPSTPAPARRREELNPPPATRAETRAETRPEPRLETRPEARPQERAAPREIPSGTNIVVRMVDPVDSEKDSIGQTYRASLDEPIMAPDGTTVVARNADVLVKLVDDKEAGRIQGKTVLTLDVVSLNINGRDVDIDTATVTKEGESRTARSGKVIGGTAALGAIIGAIAGGGKGAAIGAASGAGAGTAVQVMTKGSRVRIPSETRLTFSLQQPVRF
jgi:hypothetical protein